ncbi:unnamed protein product [Tilletia controversa]|uniref:DUF1014-domain-containing protein n=3 Tax=Tilletia TaxID=13289 RepID=A0A8X7MZF8_9BASI|nr:hypothetical protein CF336_g1134 [Tilletia laevis]KAE8204238.1 hypothetical protein CF328_g1196 [Tilletia controversa]KAE8264287.1 hypothetical protein A4X03_0g1055 [Tilletia caries]KAE8207805.1 hypothetical protein CF335_g872 [Tilletia laevis]KAE8253201.1 hypothetical protein A4X06_0g1618 [Tilletia controversa]
MAPKGNPKAVAGRARKEETANNKKKAEEAKKEVEEDSKWEQGGKGKSAADAKAEKAAEQARKKAELERLKREDEEALPSGPPEGKQKLSAQAAKRDAKAQTKTTKQATQSTSAAGDIDSALESFTADNIDDAIDALSLVTEKTDAASKGSKAADIERHPERRFKAAFEAFKERRVPELRKENPGLRLQQVQELAYKEFQKSDENPFNQVHLNYDADKGARMAALDSVRSGKEARLRDA